MYNNRTNQILIRDNDGGITPFDPEQLQLRLSAAFHRAGLPEESYIADDMVLALEYTLRRAARPELIFSYGEIDTALIRILESNGFAQAAEAYRLSSPGERLIELSTSPDTLQEFLTSHLACSPERLTKISKMCADALGTLNIESASLHLILELARHYERETVEADLLEHPATTTLETVFTRQEISALLPENAVELLKCGALRINGISPVFPAVRVFFFMENFAAHCNLHAPLTELELYPALYSAAAVLEDAYKAISAKLALADPPPVLMTLPDMFDFIHRTIGSTKADTMAVELAGVLCSRINSNIYHTSFV